MPNFRKCKGCGARLRGVWVRRPSGEYCGTLCANLAEATTDEERAAVWAAWENNLLPDKKR
jgi:hypothetical protein